MRTHEIFVDSTIIMSTDSSSSHSQIPNVLVFCYDFDTSTVLVEQSERVYHYSILKVLPPDNDNCRTGLRTPCPECRYTKSIVELVSEANIAFPSRISSWVTQLETRLGKAMCLLPTPVRKYLWQDGQRPAWMLSVLP